MAREEGKENTGPYLGSSRSNDHPTNLVQRSPRIASQGSRQGPVIAEIRVGAVVREHGSLSSVTRIEGERCVVRLYRLERDRLAQEPPRAMSRPSQATQTIRLPFRNDRGSRTSLDVAVAHVITHHGAGHGSRVDSDGLVNPPPPYSPVPPAYSLTPPA